MLTYRQRLALLQAVPSLRGLPAERVDRLAAESHEVRLDAGERLVSEGVPGRQSFVVVEGSAAVIAGGQTVAHLGPGSFVGDTQGPIGLYKTATITAETSMALLVIGPRAIEGAF